MEVFSHLAFISLLAALQIGSSQSSCPNVTLQDGCGLFTTYIGQAQQCAAAVQSGMYNFLYCGDSINCGLGNLFGTTGSTVNASCSTDGTTYPNEYGLLGLLPSVLGTYAESKICGSYMTTFTTCMDKAFSGCSTAFKTKLTTYKQRFSDNLCTNGQLASYLAPLKGQFLSALLASATGTTSGTCSTTAVVNLFSNSTCFSQFSTLLSPALFTNMSMLTFDAVEPQLSKIMKGVMACFVASLSEIGCDKTIYGSLWTAYLHLFSIPPGIDVPLKPLMDKLNLTENVKEASRFTAVVFGDPHIRYYDQGSQSAAYETCAAVGMQKYLENKYMSIYGENTHPNAGFTGATYMTAVNITFMKDSVTVGKYMAGSAALPTDFDSNTDSASLTISTKSASRVVLKYSVSGTVISLTKANGIYMMAVRQADSLYAKSSGMLVSGCPEVAVDVNTNPSVTGRKRRATADTVCASVAAAYQPSCKFDYQATGDEALAKSASELLPAMESEAVAEDTSIVEESVASGHQASIVTMLIMGAVMWMSQ